MTPGTLFRSLTPLGWLVAAAVLVTALALAGRGAGLRWDPFGLEARRLEAVEREAERAASDALARGLEAAGTAARAVRREQYHQQALVLARATAAAEVEARNAHDAQTPLDADRAARLRAHDSELCRITSDICLAAAAGASANGPKPLSVGSAASDADLG